MGLSKTALTRIKVEVKSPCMATNTKALAVIAAIRHGAIVEVNRDNSLQKILGFTVKPNYWDQTFPVVQATRIAQTIQGGLGDDAIVAAE